MNMELQSPDSGNIADLPDGLFTLMKDYGWLPPGKKRVAAKAPKPKPAPAEPEVVAEVEAAAEAGGSDEAQAGKVKGNQSGLYHSPDSPHYGSTVAEEWFDTVEDAEAAGYQHWDKKVRGE